MKIQVEEKTYDTDELIFVAKNESSDIFQNPSNFYEALYKTKDNEFILLCLAYDEYIDDYPSERTFEIETHPEIWLLDNGHERLAGFMFPEHRKKVEDFLRDMNLQDAPEKGETFYLPGEAKGEASGGY